MFFQSLGQMQSVSIVLTYAQSERPQAAKHEPCVEWSQGSAQNDVRVPDLRNPLVAAHDGPGDEIRMTTEIFRRAVKDQVDAKIDRPLI